MRIEIRDNEILEGLVCGSIPDTRKLQELRLELVGQESPDEKYMRERHHGKWANTPRLVRIPDEELREVYRAAIPLTFPGPDAYNDDPLKTHFARWTSGDSSNGAMHLTTPKGLNNLLRVFTKNEIEIGLELAYGKIVEGWGGESGICVPYRWKIGNCFDYYEELLRHQFVVCEWEVIGHPYYTKKTKVSNKSKEDKIGGRSFTNEETEETTFRVDAMFSWAKLSHVNTPEKYLLKYLAERDKRTRKEWDDREQRRKREGFEGEGELTDLHTELLKIGDPVLIYDPEWVC